MGWNDIRVSLVPSGRELVAQADPTALTMAGQPIRISRTTGRADDGGTVANLEEWINILEQFSFQLDERHENFLRMKRPDVEAFLAFVPNLMTEIILTFHLGRRGFQRLADWETLVVALFSKMSLILTDRQTRQPIAASRLRDLVTAHPNWIAWSDRQIDVPIK